jgi:DNA invertase Pin-like site-specific DNA recombinase
MASLAEMDADDHHRISIRAGLEVAKQLGRKGGRKPR